MKTLEERLESSRQDARKPVLSGAKESAILHASLQLSVV